MPSNLNAITFYDDPAQELHKISQQLGLKEVISLLEKGATGTGLTPEESVQVLDTVQRVEDLFEVTIPRDTDDVAETLGSVANQHHWSKLLREKALVALYRFIYMKIDSSGIPLVATLVHPDTGVPFDETSFTIWFCKQASINASTTFQRLAAYRKLINGLGYNIQEAFNLIITKPYLIGDTLNSMATFDTTGRIIELDPRVVSSVSRRVEPEMVEQLTALTAAIESNNTPGNQANLIEAFSPLIKKVIEEVASHPSPKDASTYVSADLLGKPGIFYTIEPGGVLVITVVTKTLSPDGEDVEELYRIPFVPRANHGVPSAVINDLIGRLPIRNRREAENLVRQLEENVPF